MDYRMLMEAQPSKFARAGQAWTDLIEDLDKIIGDFDSQVRNPLADDNIWRGEAKAAATAHVKDVRTKLQHYRDKIAPVDKALTTLAEDIETYQRRLEQVRNEINALEEPGWSIDTDGRLEYPEDQKAKAEGYKSEINGLLAQATEADRAAEGALNKADDSLKFLNNVLAEERREEEQAAKNASKLASQSPDELSFEEGKQLAALLRNHGEDPAFAGEFLERVRPKQLLQLTDHLQSMGISHWDHHGQGQGPNKDEVISTLQRELGQTLATGTGDEGREYLGEDRHGGDQENKLGQRAASYGERLTAAAKNWDTGFLGMGAHEDTGYRALGMLLHSGEYSSDFLNPVGDELVAADRDGGFEGLQNGNLNHVDERGRGGDPMVGLMTALENSPDAASSFFDPAREGNDDNLKHLINRDWPVDTYDHAPGPRHDTSPTPQEEALGHNLLGKALESATMGEQYRTEAGSRVMSEMVHEMANSNQSMQDPGQGTVPPPMRDSVGHMLSDYMGAVQDSGPPSANSSESLGLDGESPEWMNTAEGHPEPNFSQQEVYKVMGSAAYDPNAYTEMRNANMVHTELTLDEIASDDSRAVDARRGEMENVAKHSSSVFGALDESRAYAIDEFYDGKDAAYNAKIEAGGSLATWAVTGAGAITGGPGGAVAGAAGADAVDQVVEHLQQDSSHIVTRDTAELYESGHTDANDLLTQSLWEHQMWRQDVPPPPIAPGSDQLGDHPQRIIGSDGKVPADHNEWVQENNPYRVDQQVVHNTYQNGADIYANATGNRPVPVSETE